MKIQSVSDIITNSSSEVFIMPTTDAKKIDSTYATWCINYELIGPDYMENEQWKIPDICEALKINIYQRFGKEFYELTDEEVKNFIEEIKPKFLEVFGENCEYSYIDIEDHFEKYEDAYEDAHSVCIWSDWRH
ncbi:MAG: hypothetical protein [Wendovervirus sonii]|uniref:Uncharacterized protein n=1 Tax=phage Lak_Megaphage_Sonny TaxID=3109229 RepID=A0ABZ0Z383_9CAUD|nr:MAG: hypothetical protein [phage Lak_Megaphage_Sonny]